VTAAVAAAVAVVAAALGEVCRTVCCQLWLALVAFWEQQGTSGAGWHSQVVPNFCFFALLLLPLLLLLLPLQLTLVLQQLLLL